MNSDVVYETCLSPFGGEGEASDEIRNSLISRDLVRLPPMYLARRGG